jgi:hypothetical protein
MATDDQDFTVYAGEQRQVTIAVTDAAGADYDMSGVTEIIWQAELLGAREVRIEKRKTDAGITLVNVGAGTNNGARFTLSSTQTEVAGSYSHELRVIGSSANDVVMTGTMTIASALTPAA